LDNIYNNSKIVIKFKNKLDVGIIYEFKVEVIRIILKNLYIKRSIFFLKILISNLWQNYCCLQFPLNLHYAFQTFPQNITNLQNFTTKKKKIKNIFG
jgi:hypothetical protein